MIIDTDRLEDQLETAAAVVAALRAFREGTTTATWDAIEAKQPLLDALLSACCDLEYLLEE